MAFREEPGVEAMLPTYSIPTLVFVGAEDDRGGSSRNAMEAAHLIPNSTLLVFNGLGHFDTIQRLDLVLPQIRAFLGRFETTA